MTDSERFYEKLEEERGEFVEQYIENYYADRAEDLVGLFYEKLEQEGLSKDEIEEQVKEYEQDLIEEAEQDANKEFDEYIEEQMKEYDEEYPEEE